MDQFFHRVASTGVVYEFGLVGELAILERLAKDTTPEPWGTPEIIHYSEWTI